MVGTVPALGALAYKDKSRFTADLIVAKSGTRDYTSVQDAIDALPAGGGTIGVKTPEEYSISVPITITKSNVELIFSDGVTIKLADSSDCEMLVIGDGVSTYENIRIKGGIWDANQAGQTVWDPAIVIDKSNNCEISHITLKNATHGGDQRGIKLLNSDYCEIKSNYIYNCGKGIQLEYSDRNEIVDNDIVFCTTAIRITLTSSKNIVSRNICVGGAAINEGGIRAYASDTKISNNIVDGYSTGIEVDNSATGVIIDNNDVYNCAGNAINLSNGSHRTKIRDNDCISNAGGINVAVSDEVQVIGNYCYQNSGTAGINMMNSHRLTVVGNTCIENDGHGITGTYCSHSSFNDNDCFNNSQGAGDHHGLYIQGQAWGVIVAEYNTVIGNNCSDTQGTATQKYGIFLDDGADTGKEDNNLVIGNVCEGNADGTEDIKVSGVNTKLAWCIGRYTQQGSA